MAHRAGESLAVIGLASQFGDRMAPSWRNDSCVDRVLICVEPGLLLIHGRNHLPQHLSALATTVANVEGKDLTGGAVHRNPDPVAVRLLPHTAPELVELSLQPVQDHCLRARGGLDMQGRGSCLKTLNKKLSELPESNPHCTAAPAQ